ncbi:hypothetical protein [Actinoallomurus liliacearum]|uniref:hypothetical protein n=1 Tax=Actinoallomurus liliacearum TaxID=1080073 RepID=UPI0031E9AE4D
MIYESVEYPSACEACGAVTECSGAQVLLDDGLRWDVASSCPGCGQAFIACGRADIPADLRDRLLTEHGPTRLEIVDRSANSALLMKALRAELAGGLHQAKEMLQRVRAGGHTGTLPEVELLARRLCEAGIQARAGRP